MRISSIRIIANSLGSPENPESSTYSSHGLYIYLDLIKEFIPTSQNQLWISDSDRDIQYASSDYTTLLRENHKDISMTESDDSKDSAQVERINNTMKN